MGITRTVEVPDGVNVTLEGTMLKVSGPKGTLERDMRFPQITIGIEDGAVVVATDSNKKRILAMSGTLAAHTRNMIKGVQEGFEYRMKVVYSHFPIQMKLQAGRLEINNFLGEKQPRIAKVVEGVTVTVGNDEVTVSGLDKEKVGNTAANIEHATRITKRDPRVFQDGIYIVEKA
ncbi:50S ribosomal protein L6 [Methanoculleus sp. FWC-SCC1]|uniref:Large ribosomal subunit protein uL6 n=1 Tax=Methanoculleus frigidifontis TaxID=2584085 RepID=A0ABT8MC34_9EURY|nr:50S ribosomal protein L6 [Methanoculleus sp. FWC-SCC1]MDN7025507.1 50S ribosomal protein L6 [Methanoculleus sp. FWC-SCC1]